MGMRPPVIIKSYQDGIALLLDESMNFDELYLKIIEKLQNVSTFFKDAKKVLSIEGRLVDDIEQFMILQAIEEYTNLQVICILDHNSTKEERYSQILKHTQQETCAQYFYHGNLLKGQVLESETSILMIGDVEPEASVIAKSDIVIIGGLYGKAYCGYDGTTSHYIMALKMSPKLIEIGDFRYIPTEKRYLHKKDNIQPMIARIKENKLAIEPLTKELLS